ncbi:MAG: outer membrane protein [Gammaproteobacteria bacterium]
MLIALALRKKISNTTGLLLVGLAMTLYADTAPADSTASLLIGTGWNADSVVRYSTSTDTDLTFDDVAWDTDPFGTPPYYAFRVTHWFDRAPGWGWALDFTHAKMISEQDRLTRVSGLRDGMRVDGIERVGDTFQELEFSDGHNIVTLNALRRWQPFATDTVSPLRNAALYAGGGLGIAVPHVEVRTVDNLTHEYQYAGPALQLMTGAGMPLGDRWSLQVEYRLTWAELKTELNGGGELSTDALTHHVNFGIGFDF